MFCLHPASANRCVRSRASISALLGAWLAAVLERDALPSQPAHLHPTWSPTPSAPPVFGRRMQSLVGSVIKFTLLHRRLRCTNPLDAGLPTMSWTWTQSAPDIGVVLMCGCCWCAQLQCYRQKNQSRQQLQRPVKSLLSSTVVLRPMCKCALRERGTSRLSLIEGPHLPGRASFQIRLVSMGHARDAVAALVRPEKVARCIEAQMHAV